MSKGDCVIEKYNAEILHKTCQGFEFLEPWILLSVTKNLSYDRLEYTEELGRIPVSRSNFYRYKKLFYHNLDVLLEEKKVKQYKFSVEQIKKLAKQMIILVDSREKENSHILSYFDKQGIVCKREKLDFGDYSFLLPADATGQGNIYFHNSIIIERKASLEELSGNLTQKRQQFETEFLTARNNGSKIYLMIEAPEGYSGIAAHHYRTEFTPAAYMASLKTFEHRFNMNVQFIAPEYAGYYIFSTFYYFCRETLK